MNPTRFYEIVLVQTCLVALLSGFAIFTYLKFASLRTRSFELVLVLVVCDLCSNVAYTINPTIPSTQPNQGNPAWLCTLQGMSIQFFTVAAVSWSTLIAVTLDRFVVQKRTGFSIWKCHSIIWPLCAASAVLPLFPKNTYGEKQNGAWCWIRTRERGVSQTALVYGFVCFYVPCGLAMLISIVSYARVYHTVQLYLALGGNARLLRLIRALKYFPFIFVVSWIPQSIVFLWETVTDGGNGIIENSTIAIFNVAARGSFMMAIGHCLIYGLNDSVKNEWSLLLGRIKEYSLCSAIRALFKVNTADMRNTINDLDYDGSTDTGGRVDSVWSEDGRRFSDVQDYATDAAMRETLPVAVTSRKQSLTSWAHSTEMSAPISGSFVLTKTTTTDL